MALRTYTVDEVIQEIMQSGSEDEGEPDATFDDDDDEREDENVLRDDLPNNADVTVDEGVGGDGEGDLDPRYEMETDLDDDDDDAAPVDEPWIRNLTGFPSIPYFTGRSGFRVDMGEDPKAVDIWRLIIDDAIIKRIKRETNKYAHDCIADKMARGPLEARSIFSTWKRVTKADIYNFIAICIHMGLVKKPQLHDYWSVHPGLHSSYAAQILPRDRFFSILAFLHLNNNDTYIPFGEEDHDPIHKIRPFLTHVQDKFQELYTPHKEVCVDEAICPFKGRSRFRVYMKDKPTKWGFKFYELCESKTGYVYRLEMYCAEPGLSNKPRDVTLRLMAPLLKKGYHLYIDNYYCEPTLAAALARQRTMVCGTVRKNRIGMPRDLGEQPMARGDIDYRRKGSVVACRWKDKKDVFMLSTMHEPKLERSRGRFEDKNKPTAVISYIANMAGVDQSDQMISYFPMHRKSLKWWKKPFFHLLTLCTIQTMILLNKHRKQRNLKPICLENVIKSLLLEIPTVRLNPPDRAAEGPANPMVRLQARHFPSLLPPIPSKNKPKKGCYVCYSKMKAAGASPKDMKNKKPLTRYECTKCKNGKFNVALCASPCFEIYHTKKNVVP